MQHGKTSYSEIGGPDGKLAKCQPFRGNTMRAEWDGTELYEVFSYATLIAVFNWRTGDKFVSDERYSVTTSRQQNLCRTWLGTARTRGQQ